MTPMPQGAVLYGCPCGAQYLIALSAPARDEAWLDSLRGAASAIGATLVDGALPAFICGDCGREHQRNDLAVDQMH